VGNFTNPLLVRGQKPGIALPNRHENLGLVLCSIKRIGEGSGKLRDQEINIQLKIARAVNAVDDERTAVLVRSCHQVQRQLPGGLAGYCDHVGKLAPVKVAIAFSRGGLIAGKRLKVQFEGIEVIAIESCYQDVADLIEIAGDFQFLDGAAYGKIIDHNLPLLNGALRHTSQLAKL